MELRGSTSANHAVVCVKGMAPHVARIARPALQDNQLLRASLRCLTTMHQAKLYGAKFLGRERRKTRLRCTNRNGERCISLPKVGADCTQPEARGAKFGAHSENHRVAVRLLKLRGNVPRRMKFSNPPKARLGELHRAKYRLRTLSVPTKAGLSAPKPNPY